jgi:uncharacterized cupredoxin-like copper-binding protein
MYRSLTPATLFFCFIAIAPAAAGPGGAGHGHNTQHGHDMESFSAGQPGDPKKPARIIQVIMREGDGKMMFVPNKVEIKKGEQIKFELRNNGELEHEFVLASHEENLKHAEAMKKNPDMEHADPNAKRLPPKGSADMVWKFTKAGQFEFACLIPGHSESGMIGTVIVK